MDETKLTATLPNLDVEITRRASDDGAAELVTLTLRATPNLQAAARLMAPQMLLLPWQANPFVAAWAQTLSQSWLPSMALPPKRD